MKIFFTVFLFFSISQAADWQVINTSGAAEKYIDPNMVIISVNAFGLAESAKVAQERQAIEFKRIKSVVEKFKIKKEDFITENLSLAPQYRYDEKTQQSKTVGFKADHQIKIIIRQKNDVGSLLDALSSANKVDKSGATINSISWDSDSRKAVAESLIGEAVTDARRKADKLAIAAGVKIKAVQTINYNDASDTPMPRHYEAKAMAMSNVATELGSGAIRVKTEVTIQYRIE